VENNGQPPIIKKIKKGGHGHHGGAWKVAYADFVTAMMALFIVLWILGSSEEMKKAVAEYFRDPSFMLLGMGKSVIDGGRITPPTPSPLGSSDSLAQKMMEKQRLTQMGEEIKEQLGSDATLKEILDQIKIEYTDEGMRIELVESLEEAFFEVGTSSLNPQAFNILKLIGDKVSKMENLISIEGHTDSRPYANNGLGYTNYELSADRANSARRALVLGGVPENQILDIRGYADKKLKNFEDPFDIVNRRVSIIIKYSDQK